jgi:hypothetical protein
MMVRYKMRKSPSKSGGGPVYRCRDKPFLCAEFVTLGFPPPAKVDLILSDEGFEGSTPVEVKSGQRVLLPGSKSYRGGVRLALRGAGDDSHDLGHLGAALQTRKNAPWRGAETAMIKLILKKKATTYGIDPKQVPMPAYLCTTYVAQYLRKPGGEWRRPDTIRLTLGAKPFEGSTPAVLNTHLHVRVADERSPKYHCGYMLSFLREAVYEVTGAAPTEDAKFHFTIEEIENDDADKYDKETT